MTEYVDPRNAGTPEYAEVLRKINEEGRCPFCPGELAKTHDNPVIFTTGHWLVTTNKFSYPKAEFKFLIILRHRHVEETLDLTDEEMNDMLIAYKWLLQDKKLPGSTFLWRQGETSRTGASVKHLHAQVIVGNGNGREEDKVFARVG